MTIYQLIKKARKHKKHKRSRAKILKKNPQRIVKCVKMRINKPKKPNSALRKVAKVYVNFKIDPKKTGRILFDKHPTIRKYIIAYIAGFGHNLREGYTALCRGGNVPDLPGINYKLIRGKYDFSEMEKIPRLSRRSLFGVKKNELNVAIVVDGYDKEAAAFEALGEFDIERLAKKIGISMKYYQDLMAATYWPEPEEDFEPVEMIDYYTEDNPWFEQTKAERAQRKIDREERDRKRKERNLKREKDRLDNL